MGTGRCWPRDVYDRTLRRDHVDRAERTLIEWCGRVEDGFHGWGRVITDFETGEWGFETIKPGRVMGRDGKMMAPHINLWIVARGISIGLNTRLYFDDEVEANAEDPVIGLIEWERRRKTLLARRMERDGKPVYRFDIRVQGEDETVFFDI